MRLRLSAEREYAVPPLGLAGHGEQLRVNAVTESDAVRLFVERAQAVKQDFALTDQNAPAIAEICRRLDGLPLAIELAAARIKVLPPAALLARLDHRLPLLTGGGRDLPARQQTMRDTVAWSYDLLDPTEQTLFRRLGVFSGGFTLEGAAVVADEPGGEIDILDVVTSLVDKSLLRQEGDETPRFEMLETVREFALERLEANGEAAAIQARHAAFFLARAEEAEHGFFSPQEIAWLDWCAAELGNIRAALDWSTRVGGDPGLGLRLGAALWWFWLRRGGLREGREWLERGLASHPAAPPMVRAKALAVAGTLASFLTDYEQGLAMLNESLALYSTVADPFGLAQAQLLLGDCYQDRDETDLSIPPLEQALAAFRQLGATAWAGMTLFYLSRTASHRRDYERARALAEEALDLCRQAEFRTGIAMTLSRLGTVAFQQRDHEPAERYFREALALRLQLDDRYGMLSQLTDLAYVVAARGEAERAARLDGAASALRHATGANVQQSQRAEYERFIAGLRDVLGSDRFEAVWAAGHALAPEQTVAAAREVVSTELALPLPAFSQPLRRSSAGLTPRELDVLRLLVEGRSDREIGEALFIGTRTMQTHVANLFAKLEVNSRAEAAAVAVRRGLV